MIDENVALTLSLVLFGIAEDFSGLGNESPAEHCVRLKIRELKYLDLLIGCLVSSHKIKLIVVC